MKVVIRMDEDVEGFGYGVCPGTRLDHPSTLGIAGVPQVAAWVMARVPCTSPEIVVQETGARTCLHARPGRLTILECRFNETTHYLY